MRVLPVLALLIAACGAPRQEQAPSEPARAEQGQAAEAAVAMRPDRLLRDFAGTQAPAIPLETGPDGATETLADILAANPGQPALVNLWATWCTPCLKELPTLDRLAAATKGRLVVVPISQDMEGWRKVAPAFTPEKYPNLSTRLESGMQFGAAVKATGLPLSILYGPDGREMWRYAGDLDWASPEARALLGVEGSGG